jgi:hypothetical protein
MYNIKFELCLLIKYDTYRSSFKKLFFFPIDLESVFLVVIKIV